MPSKGSLKGREALTTLADRVEKTAWPTKGPDVRHISSGPDDRNGHLHRGCGCDGLPASDVGSTRPGHGVVFVEQLDDHQWAASWCDLGVVSTQGHPDVVLAWARQQPAAEHLLMADGLGEVPLEALPPGAGD